MKILHLNQRDDGGAGRAMLRLHQGLQQAGVDSLAHVQIKNTDEDGVSSPQSALGKFSAKLKLSEHIDNLPLRLYPNRDNRHFSLQCFPDSLASVVESANPDIIHLHWVSGGFLRLESLKKFNRPIIWTLHDMWTFTGGCHYNDGCDNYKHTCGKCPALKSEKKTDLSHWMWKRKARAWKNLDLTIVAPSNWMANCARESSLLKDCLVEVIPNGLDTNAFKPVDRAIARNLLNLPEDKYLVLFGAANPLDTRKGIQLLLPALHELHHNGMNKQIELLVFGGTAANPITDVDFQVNYLGRLTDNVSLALAYSAADVFIAPSLEDNLPNTLVEALACGTPGVAFNIGGIPDIIDHKHNGYLATPFEPQSLARGIEWTLKETSRDEQLRINSHQKAERIFGLAAQAHSHIALYEKILARAEAKKTV